MACRCHRVLTACHGRTASWRQVAPTRCLVLDHHAVARYHLSHHASELVAAAVELKSRQGSAQSRGSGKHVATRMPPLLKSAALHATDALFWHALAATEHRASRTAPSHPPQLGRVAGLGHVVVPHANFGGLGGTLCSTAHQGRAQRQQRISLLQQHLRTVCTCH